MLQRLDQFLNIQAPDNQMHKAYGMGTEEPSIPPRIPYRRGGEHRQGHDRQAVTLCIHDGKSREGQGQFNQGRHDDGAITWPERKAYGVIVDYNSIRKR